MYILLGCIFRLIRLWFSRDERQNSLLELHFRLLISGGREPRRDKDAQLTASIRR